MPKKYCTKQRKDRAIWFREYRKRPETRKKPWAQRKYLAKRMAAWRSKNRDHYLAYVAEWRKKHPENCRNTALKSRFGIDAKTYDALLSKQKGVCAICKQPECARDKGGKLRALAVDHCHQTTGLRGLLCGRCNNGLGYFMDSVKRLEAAIKYLSK